MSIMRVVKNKENPYVMMNKTSIEDPNISYKAKGLLAYILSKPDDWVIRVPDLIKHSTDGSRAVYSGLKELRQAGYMVKRQYKNPKTNQIYWIEEVYETPNNEAIKVFQEQQEKLIVINEKKRTTLIAKKEENGEEIPYSQNSDMDGQERTNFGDNVDSVDKSEKKPYVQNSDMDENNENFPDNLQIPYSGFVDIHYENKHNENKHNSEVLISNDVPSIDLLNNEGNKKGKEKNPSSFSSIELWNRIISIIKNSEDMTDVSFNTWFASLEIQSHNNNSMVILAPNQFTKGIIESRWIEKAIQPAVKQVLGHKLDIVIGIGTEKAV